MTSKASNWIYFVLPISSLRQSERQSAVEALHPESVLTDQPG